MMFKYKLNSNTYNETCLYAIWIEIRDLNVAPGKISAIIVIRGQNLLLIEI